MRVDIFTHSAPMSNACTFLRKLDWRSLRSRNCKATMPLCHVVQFSLEPVLQSRRQPVWQVGLLYRQIAL